MRKGIKVLTALAAITTASAMSLTAFAAVETNVNTKVGGGKVTVISTVTGVPEGEQVAYLVHKGELGSLSNDDIVFIDQKASGAGDTVDFSFTTEVGKVNGTQVVAGSEKSAASSVSPDEQNTVKVDGSEVNKTGDIKIAGGNVTWKVTGEEGKVIYIDAADESSVGTEIDTQEAGMPSGQKTEKSTVYFLVLPGNGNVLESITVGGADGGKPNGKGLYALTVNGDTDVTFKFKKSDEATTLSNLQKSVYATAEGTQQGDKRSVTVIGKVTGPFTEVGMTIDGEEYKALGVGSNGLFGITYEEEVTEQPGETDKAEWTIKPESKIKAYTKGGTPDANKDVTDPISG